MPNWLRILCLCIVVGVAPASGFGHEPSFPPAAYLHHNSGQVYLLPYPAPVARGVSMPTPTYAYGWFGVVPRCHKAYHHGYYNNYCQSAER